MRVNGSGVMGPCPGRDWTEVEIPYRINRNERDVEEGDEYPDMPCWDVWDWLEQQIPDMHDVDEEGNEIGGVSWMRMLRIDKFCFHFRDPNKAMLFKLTFGGQ